MALLTVDPTVSRRGRVLGCLLGGAVGDALGAPAEFLTDAEIRARYGAEGVREPGAEGAPAAFTDDTQLVLFTAEGLIRWRLGTWRGEAADRVAALAAAYRRWLGTQGGGDARPEDGWLASRPGLRRRCAPGLTVVGELEEQARLGSARFAHNNSKGNGGLVRIAPFGLVLDDPYDAACDAARLTHGHELGWSAAGAFAVVIARLRLGDDLSRAVAAARQRVVSHLALTRILDRAVDLAHCEIEPARAVRELGLGRVAEEALAIAVYCALRAGSFEDALRLAANHDGDSDSTASLTGQLLGTRFGDGVIPAAWRTRLEQGDLVAQVAHDLYDVFLAADDPLTIGREGIRLRTDLDLRYPDATPGRPTSEPAAGLVRRAVAQVGAQG